MTAGPPRGAAPATGAEASRGPSGRADDATWVPTRIVELDGLRGLACLAIMVYHLKARWLPVGWAAVDLFFVLSGFLITNILLEGRGRPGTLGRFYGRRALRIWPIYYLAIGALVAAGPWLPTPSAWPGLPWHLLFLQNIPRIWGSRSSEMSPYLPHFWSLAVEAQFYLIWPAFVLVGGRVGAIVSAVAITAAAFAARRLGFDPWLLAARADGLAMGGLLAAILGVRGGAGRAEGVARRRATFVGIAVASGLYLAWLAGSGLLPKGGRATPATPDAIIAVSALSFAAVGLSIDGAGSRRLAWLRDRRLLWFGKISYGLYVYHYLVYFIANDAFDSLGFRGRPAWQDGIKVGLSLLIAGLSWRCIEAPLMRLGRRAPEAPAAGIPGPHRARERATRPGGRTIGSW